MSLRRDDTRDYDELRPLSIHYEGLDRVDGSARFGFGECKALASVSGPIEVRLNAEQPSKATFEVLLRPLSNVPGTESKSLSTSLRTLLTPSILLSRYPRTLIQLVVQSLTPSISSRFHPSLIAAFINVSTLTLLNAGSIPMRGVICAVSVGRLRSSASATSSSALVLDLSERELSLADAYGCFAFMFSAELTGSPTSDAIPPHGIVWSNWQSTAGGFDEDDVMRAKELAGVGAQKVWIAMKESLGAKANKTVSHPVAQEHPRIDDAQMEI